MSTPRHKFDYVSGDDTVCVTTTAESLSELVEKFEDYLKACGFHFEGRQLDLVDIEEAPAQGILSQEELDAITANRPYPASGYVPPCGDLDPSEDKETP